MVGLGAVVRNKWSYTADEIYTQYRSEHALALIFTGAHGVGVMHDHAPWPWQLHAVD